MVTTKERIEDCEHIEVRTLLCGKKVDVCRPNAPYSCRDTRKMGECKKGKKR